MRLAARRCRLRGTGNGGCARGALKRYAHRDLGRLSPRCSRPARASPRTASSRGIHGDGAGRRAREVSATSPGGVHVGATVTLVQVARSVSCPELGAGRRFRTWCARLQHEENDDHDHHDDEREDRDVTGAHGNQRIPHRAGASPRCPGPRSRRRRGSGLRERSTGSSAASRQAVRLTGTGPRSYAPLATYLALMAARARTLARFPGLAHV